MNTFEFAGAMFSLTLVFWPFTKFLRKIFGKSGFSNNTTVLFTFIILFVLYQGYSYLNGSMRSEYVLCSLLSLGIHAFLDYHRGISNSKVISSLHHVSTRWVAGVIFFLPLIVCIKSVIQAWNVQDEYYLISLLLTLVISYFIVRKR